MMPDYVVHEIEEFKKRYSTELPKVFDILSEFLGKSLFGKPNVTHNGKHPFVQVYCIPPFDIKSHEPELSKLLSPIKWTFVFRDKQQKDGYILRFGAAPKVMKKLATVYHATRVVTIKKIVDDSEVLKPSNDQRRTTDRTDTTGKIHVCENLHDTAPGSNDSAVFWMNLLSQDNEFEDSYWGILRIDMAGLPVGADVYLDIQSESGIIIDQLDGISANFIEETGIETDPSIPYTGRKKL